MGIFLICVLVEIVAVVVMSYIAGVMDWNDDATVFGVLVWPIGFFVALAEATRGMAVRRKQERQQRALAADEAGQQYLAELEQELTRPQAVSIK